MIPPLVALIVSAVGDDDDEQLKRCADWAASGEFASIENFCASLPATERLPPLPMQRLVPSSQGKPVVRQLLNNLGPEQLVGELKSPSEGIALKAGLYQIHDFLDQSHELAQQADDMGSSRAASFWHGIMHRREPDYGNARYWFRRVGNHSVFESLAREVRELLQDRRFGSRLRFDGILDRRGHWDAMAFVDLCEQSGKEWDVRAQAAAMLQSIEMRCLLEFSIDAATGRL